MFFLSAEIRAASAASTFANALRAKQAAFSRKTRLWVWRLAAKKRAAQSGGKTLASKPAETGVRKASSLYLAGILARGSPGIICCV
jgi:hypothetical protein